VPSTHFAFQLRIFWICFALTAAAGALSIGAMFDLLLHPPLPHPMIHGQPDAQLVQIADRWLRPADAQVWSYGFDFRPVRLPRAVSLQLWIGAAMMTAAVLFSWIGPIFGMLRLAAGRPIGHEPDQIVQAGP
jgi:hypothetical protein